MRLLALSATLVLLHGCATITGSELQAVAVSTETERGEPLEKALCTLRNDKGSWEVVSPGSVQITRSARDLLVDCRRDGHTDGLLRVISRAGGGMFGNILFGGVIGAAIDHDKGTGYDYPETLRVRMGRMNIVDMREEQASRRDATTPER